MQLYFKSYSFYHQMMILFFVLTKNQLGNSCCLKLLAFLLGKNGHSEWSQDSKQRKQSRYKNHHYQFGTLLTLSSSINLTNSHILVHLPIHTLLHILHMAQFPFTGGCLCLTFLWMCSPCWSGKTICTFAVPRATN